jgi:hypothetical protein
MPPWRIALPLRCFFAAVAVILLATVIVVATSTSSRAEGEPKQVLMLHSFGLRFKPWTDYAQTIRSEITRRSQRSVDFHDHSLLNARLNDDKSDGPFVDYLHAVYVGKRPDLIVAIGAPAANFVQRFRQRLFAGTPMIFTAVEQRRVQYDKLTDADTVAAVAHDFPAAFENILRVLPRTKTIAIVNGVSPNEAFLPRGDAPGTRAADRAGRTQMVQRAVVRRHSERRIQSSTSQRHLLAFDERRCGRGRARDQQRS